MKKFMILFLLLFNLSISILSSQCNYSTELVDVGSIGECVMGVQTYILPLRAPVCISGNQYQYCYNTYRQTVRKDVFHIERNCNKGIEEIQYQ